MDKNRQEKIARALEHEANILQKELLNMNNDDKDKEYILGKIVAYIEAISLMGVKK